MAIPSTEELADREIGHELEVLLNLLVGVPRWADEDSGWRPGASRRGHASQLMVGLGTGVGLTTGDCRANGLLHSSSIPELQM